MRSIYLFSISPHPEAIHINPLDITFFKLQIDFSSYDYLILTSKQAVKALQQYDESLYKKIKALCISQATAKAYEVLGGEVLEVGSGYGDDLANTIIKYPKQTKWLYLRAKEVASDFATASNKLGYSVDEMVVYASRCSVKIQEIDVAEDAILIFTSPSSVQCFLRSHTIKSTQQIIVIGKSTAKALPEGVSAVVSDERSIESCMKIAFQRKIN
ncbi:MAG: uroporphyrinogen-III synthase [Epsilonproteobacteria bacterium]|nr:uroporphyrinogen-III synthase [Campylobacterota bacterium]